MLKLYVYNFKINIDFYIEPLLTLLPDESSDYLYFDSISSLGLYDTDKNNIKLLCRQNNQNIICNFITITIEEKINIECIDDENIAFTTSKVFTEKNCYLSIFDNQYLFCCGIKDLIKCFNINKDKYTILNQFKISIPGDNSYLTIKINNDCANLFFMNTKNNINTVLGYYICIPKCNTNLYILLNSLNEDKDNGKISNIAEIKTNKYYFEILNKIENIGYFTLNNEKLEQRKLIKNNDLLDIIVTRKDKSIQLSETVPFKVSVEEESAYSITCNLQLVFLACYQSCSNCTEGARYSASVKHNCIECKENYYKSPDNNNNCFSKEEKQINWYLDEANSKFGICNEKCSCSCTGPLKSDCLKCTDEENVNNNFATTNAINEKFDSDISLSEFKNEIINFITSYTDTSYFFNGTDFLAMILSSDNLEPEEQLKKGITSFDLGNCTNVLKEYYKIKKDENLIIINIQYKNDENIYNNNKDKYYYLGKDVILKIYDSSGRNLDLSICKEDIKIMKYIGNDDKIDINAAQILSNKGIDVFNAEDDFFNDICYPYDNPNKNDITINDRRNDIFQNVTFCQNGCRYDGIDYNLKIANCLCNSSFIQKEKLNIANADSSKETINFKTLKKTLMENLFSFNLEILKCYKLFLNIKYFIHNYGFYCMTSMAALQIIFLCIYLIKKLKHLQYFMMKFKINNNMKKYQNKIHKSNNKKKIIKSNLNKAHKVKSKKKQKNVNNILYKKAKSESRGILLNSSNHLKPKKNIYITNNYIQTINIKSPTKQKIKKKLQIKLFNLNIQEFDYEEAIAYDHRSFIKIYLGFLINSQIILDTFFNQTNLDLLVIKLSFLVFTFQISFFLNAFFYTDEYISNAYHNNGVLDFISGLPKSIYSFIAALLITNLLKILSNSKNELIKVIRNNSQFNEYFHIIKIKLSKLSKKLIIYFTLVLLFESFFLYYVTIFCTVYKYSQKYWFLGCLESFGIDLLSALIICIFLALFRYIGIKKKIKCLYVFADIINTFL